MDVEGLRDPSESEEHWELRRAFILKWKSEIDEDSLICLARAFCNVELLGCRYPAAVMKKIALLSKEVAHDFREKRKKRIRRTFVSASAAAEERAKGSNKAVKNDGPIDFVASQPSRFTVNNQYGDLVLFQRCSSNISQINDSCQSGKIPIEWRCQKIQDQWECACIINGISVHNGTGETQKLAKDDAARESLKVLQKKCYTIVTIQKHLSKDNNVISAGKVKNDGKTMNDGNGAKVESAVASRMMKLMGWKGGGLGASSDGRNEPVIPNGMHISRAGLGNENSETRNIRKALLQTILDFKNADGATHDLVFANDFTKDERKEMHNLALKNGLKSKSYGQDDDRYIVISKPITPHQILYSLIQSDGENEKYKLIHPTD